MNQARELCRTRAVPFIAALVLGLHGTAWAAAKGDDDLASRFATAPEAAPDQQQLVLVEVNGVSFGSQLIRVAKGRITLPPATARTLGIAGQAGEAIELAPGTGIASRLDEAQGTLSLTVPVSRLAAQRFASEADAVRVNLSPETWGAYVDYDLNARHDFGSSATEVSQGAGGISGRRSSGFGSWGGLAELRVLAPDAVGGFGWAYDSTRLTRDALVRLDSTLTWRPKSLDIAVSAGDVVSTTTATLGQGRPYRFGGVQVGTDYSGTPGWSSSPIPSVTGTAQAQSSIDVYLDGQRTFRTSTPGGPFSLVLPPGSTGSGTSVVVTDVTGRSVLIPVEVAQSSAQLLRQGTFLWSAGLGAPRFAYGSSTTGYDDKLYGHGNARYGAFNNLTATVHAEGGAGLAEAEVGADMAVMSRLAVHASVAGSRSARGTGGAGRLGLSFSGPWNLGLEAQASRTAGPFDDVVSVSGRTYGRARGIDPLFSLPATSELSARLSWQPSQRLSLSASYQSNTYKGSVPVGFASLSANYLAAGRIPLFANLSHAMGGQRSTTLIAGVSMSLGSAQASVSGGYGTGSNGGNGSSSQGSYSGGFTASQPLGESVGDIGWNAYGARSPTGTFVTADTQVRAGYAVPGVAVQSFGKQVTGYATLRGSAGVVGMHPFLSEPASGGIIIADAGRSGVPVQLNGYDKGRTSLDGKMALSGAVAGAPQRVAIDTARMPIDAVPSETDKLVTVRDRGATLAVFGVQSAGSSALMNITVHGQPPPVGSTVVSATSSAPISKEGRAYLSSLDRNEVLTVEMPDGSKCLVRTDFDGKGGVGRRLGTLPCRETH
jgi:outer membrane usher protein